jgi:hypothetical protein
MPKTMPATGKSARRNQPSQPVERRCPPSPAELTSEAARTGPIPTLWKA